MEKEISVYFEVRRAPNGSFYVTRQDREVCTRSGALVDFDTERDAQEFLAEIGDIVMH